MANGKNNKKKNIVKSEDLENMHEYGVADQKAERKRWKNQNWKQWVDSEEEEDDETN